MYHQHYSVLLWYTTLYTSHSKDMWEWSAEPKSGCPCVAEQPTLIGALLCLLAGGSQQEIFRVFASWRACGYPSQVAHVPAFPAVPSQDVFPVRTSACLLGAFCALYLCTSSVCSVHCCATCALVSVRNRKVYPTPTPPRKKGPGL